MIYKYEVVSPEMWEIVPILDDGSGPKEYFYDYAEVKAREPIEAVVKAVRSKAFKTWRQWCEADDISPYEGVKAERMNK
jgi:hypothetical protein